MKECHEFSSDIQQATAKGNPRLNCPAGVEMEETTDANDLQGVIRIHIASEKQEGCLRHGVGWMVTNSLEKKLTTGSKVWTGSNSHWSAELDTIGRFFWKPVEGK